MLSGIREILVITTPGDQVNFQRLLGDGKPLGMTISYSVQEKPEGLAQAFIIGEQFIGDDFVALILGDNIFHGSGLGRDLSKATNPDGALIFGYEVADPQRYGVAEVDSLNNVTSIEEKPVSPKSSLAIPGLYFFDKSVCKKARNVQKSARGELEITSVLEAYRLEGRLQLKILPRGTTWMDCGTVQSVNDASNYIRAIEERQGFKVGSIEEVAWRNSWISGTELRQLANSYGKNEYAQYLQRLLI
jgi:glucose-1-phosphate thymidylyltransferase